MDVESARRVGTRDEKTLKTICSRERREEAVISVYYIGESWRVVRMWFSMCRQRGGRDTEIPLFFSFFFVICRRELEENGTERR